MDLATELDELVQKANENPLLQEYLKKVGFRYPYSRLQYVKGSRKQRGYIRRRPFVYEQPSIAQAEARLRFAEAATAAFGIQGVVETADKRQISASAKEVGDAIRGKTYVEKVTPQVKRLREILQKVQNKPVFLNVGSIKL